MFLIAKTKKNTKQHHRLEANIFLYFIVQQCLSDKLKTQMPTNQCLQHLYSNFFMHFSQSMLKDNMVVKQVVDHPSFKLLKVQI